MSANEGMGDLIKYINQLQEACLVSGDLLDLDLPQIVVLGGQSAGKSSVLESFVGKDFLPRGSDIVTRRPLILQLITNNGEEYAEFPTENGKKIILKDLEEVKRKIESLTDEVAGRNKGISDLPINLKIFSPHLVNLTVVDLPGLTKVPIGDQPENIEQQIRDLIMTYARKENALLLAVSPANQDLANSDSLKLAREVDPDGKRTIGVISKLDLMDEGTNAARILENKVYSLDRGYIGVVNRSQKDISDGRNIKHALEKEKQFFKNNPAYSHLAKRQGTDYLQQYLNRELGAHIARKLPGLRSSLAQQKTALEDELGDLDGDQIDRNKDATLYRFVERFKRDIYTTIHGNSEEVRTDEIEGGACINLAFYSEVANMLSVNIAPNDEEIGRIIRNLHGISNPLFLSEISFKVVVRHILERYRDPLKAAVEVISAWLYRAVERSGRTVENFPCLQQEVLFLVSGTIRKQEAAAQICLSDLVDAQAAFMNTRHSQFGKNVELNNIFATENVASGGPSSPSPKIDALHRGWLYHHNYRGTWSRDFWVVLTKTDVVWFEDEKELNRILSVPAETITCTAKTNSRTGHTKFIFKSNVDETITNGTKSVVLELKSRNSSDTTTWITKLKEAGINLEHEDKVEAKEYASSSAAESPVEVSQAPVNWNERLLKDDHIQGQSAKLIRMVRSYMLITQENIFDLAIKYITLHLIMKTLKYTQEDLYPDLLKTENAAEEYLKISDERAKRTEEVKQLLQSSSRALEILEKCSIFKNPEPNTRLRQEMAKGQIVKRKSVDDSDWHSEFA